MAEITMLLEQFQQIHQHVLESDKLVSNQRDLIKRLRQDGHPTEEAEELLAVLENTHRMQIADRDRIERELKEAGSRSSDAKAQPDPSL